MSGAVDQRRVLVGQLLKVIGDDDAGDGSPGGGDAHGPVDQVAELTRHAGGCDKIRCDVLEQRLQVHFLLIMSADGGARLLTYDSDDGHVIHLRVIQASQQVDRTRPRSGIAESDLTGELGVGRGHEGRHLLVANLDVLEAVLNLLQRHVETTDTIAGVAVDALDSPLLQALPYEVADVDAHGR
jgi:hypothetical protein